MSDEGLKEAVVWSELGFADHGRRAEGIDHVPIKEHTVPLVEGLSLWIARSEILLAHGHVITYGCLCK